MASSDEAKAIPAAALLSKAPFRKGGKQHFKRVRLNFFSALCICASGTNAFEFASVFQYGGVPLQMVDLPVEREMIPTIINKLALLDII